MTVRSRSATIVTAGSALLLAVTLAACGGSSKGAGPTPTTKVPPTSSTLRATTTTTIATPPATPATPITISSPADGTSPRGSGCSPTGTALPDGVWFGELKSVDAAASTITLDLECMYVGPAADAKAASMGRPTPVPNGYLITNQSDQLFTIPAWPNVQVLPLEMVGSGGFTGANQPAITGLSGATTILTMPAPKIVWVQITGGKAIVIQSQFTP